MSLRIKDVMTPQPRTVGKQTTMAEALKIMEDSGFRHLPIVEGGKLLGLVSERELRILENMQSVNSAHCTVEDFILNPPYTVGPDTPVHDVATAMADKKYGSAVVVDGAAVVGVFTTIDALRTLAGLLSE